MAEWVCTHAAYRERKKRMVMTINDKAPNDAGELLDTLDIQEVKPRAQCGGSWVTGTIAGYHFEALVFPERASNPDYEVGGDSRISKLWIGTQGPATTAFNWDRGADVPAANQTVRMIVDLLAAGLAETIFARSE